MTTVEEMEADLINVVVRRSISHAENILVWLRQHEAAGLSHEASIRNIHERIQK